MTSSWLLTSTPFRRRAFGKKRRRRRRRRRKRNGSSGGQKAWSLLLLLFPRRRLGARGSRRHHISIYTLYYSKEFVIVSFFGVFLVNFFGEIFFSFYTFSFKKKTQHVEKTDRHTLHRVSSKVYVCVRACLWCDCRLKGTI